MGNKLRLKTILKPNKNNTGGIKKAEMPNQRNTVKWATNAPAVPSQFSTSAPDSARDADPQDSTILWSALPVKMYER